MPYEGPPASCWPPAPALLAAILSFVPDMDPSLIPPPAHWEMKLNGVPQTYLSADWTGNHFLTVTFDHVAPQPGDTVTLEYGPIHPDLRTHFGTAYPPWQPITLDPCP